MNCETYGETCSSGQYRVVARQPLGEVREEYFDSRLKAERLMETLVEQGYAVMMRHTHSQ